MTNTTTPARIAQITLQDGFYFPTVDTLMIEGHYQRISNAPFARAPRFIRRSDAIAFIEGFGIAESDITFKSI